MREAAHTATDTAEGWRPQPSRTLGAARTMPLSAWGSTKPAPLKSSPGNARQPPSDQLDCAGTMDRAVVAVGRHRSTAATETVGHTEDLGSQNT